MANLTTQTKYINIVVRKTNWRCMDYDDEIKNWCDNFCELYAYIYHIHDINLEGEIETPHLHLVATLKTPRRLSTTLTSFCENLNITTLGVMIDKCNSYEGSLQYLIHKNDKRKTPHKIEEIKHNYPSGELEMIINSDNDNLTAERLYKIVINARNNYDIILAVGLNRYHHLRNVIRDMKEDITNKRARSEKEINSCALQ